MAAGRAGRSDAGVMTVHPSGLACARDKVPLYALHVHLRALRYARIPHCPLRQADQVQLSPVHCSDMEGAHAIATCNARPCLELVGSQRALCDNLSALQ